MKRNFTHASTEVTQTHQNGRESFTWLGVTEQIYTAGHPAVLEWSTYFHERILHLRIFETFESLQPKSVARAKAVGVLWYNFSSFMPWLLCQAAALMTTNEKRHYVIQTAFEELGMRDVREIHPEMFWDVASKAGLTINDRMRIEKNTCIQKILTSLKTNLYRLKNDTQVMGLLLGLEAPATENIETIFSSLAYKHDLIDPINKHKFFRLHRLIEIEHVRLTVANFLRFCDSQELKNDFIQGFDLGAAFWNEFWAEAARATTYEAVQSELR